MISPRLQVLICTYGAAGIQRIAAAGHPRVEGVEYVVCWQQPEGELPVPEELRRDDFRIYTFRTRGSGANRNHCLDHASAPLLLMADDDLKYTADGLQAVMDAFDNNPGCEVLTFMYDTDSETKEYPPHSFDLHHAPKGYFASAIELAFRSRSVLGKFRFNEHFGVNCDFCSGEDDLFFNSLLKAGLPGRFIPHAICFHPGPSTCTRQDPDVLTANKGAVFLGLHPRLWPLYMLSHALRQPRCERLRYCRLWISGVRRARSLNVFSR